jgi:hypothetical protein
MATLPHIAMHSPVAQLLRGTKCRMPSFAYGKAKGCIPID